MATPWSAASPVLRPIWREWRGHAPSGRRFENCAEVYFFRFDGPRIADVWGIEDTLERFRQLALEPGEI
jgi:hypothetical protein